MIPPGVASAPASSLRRTLLAPPGPTAIRVETPDVPRLPFVLEGGVKVFHLVAEPVKHRVPARPHGGRLGLQRQRCPGRRSRCNEGDRVRIVFENQLPEMSPLHWHGLEVPIEMDGVPGLSQDAIPPGGTFTYEFTLHQHGTFFYHSHMAMQEMMGMIGLFVIHPRVAHDAARATATSASSSRSGPSCPTTPCRTRWRWSSTG